MIQFINSRYHICSNYLENLQIETLKKAFTMSIFYKITGCATKIRTFCIFPVKNYFNKFISWYFLPIFYSNFQEMLIHISQMRLSNNIDASLPSTPWSCRGTPCSTSPWYDWGGWPSSPWSLTFLSRQCYGLVMDTFVYIRFKKRAAHYSPEVYI
jgi:hypothetical protein